MAKGGGERGTLLPVSADDGKGNGGRGGGDDAVLFKGSAMTRRGAAAALSYMACSGTRYARSAPSLPPGRAAWFACFCSGRAAAWTARGSGSGGLFRSSRSGNLGTREPLHHVFDLLLVLVVTFSVEFSYVILEFVQDG